MPKEGNHSAVWAYADKETGCLCIFEIIPLLNGVAETTVLFSVAGIDWLPISLPELLLHL